LHGVVSRNFFLDYHIDPGDRDLASSFFRRTSREVCEAIIALVIRGVQLFSKGILHGSTILDCAEPFTLRSMLSEN
jgi:hypothetical protein